MTPILPQSTAMVNLCLSCTLPACVYDSPRINPNLCPIESAKLSVIALESRIPPGVRHCPCGHVGPLKRDFLSLDGYLTRRCHRCRTAKRRGGLHLRRYKIQPTPAYKPKPQGRPRAVPDSRLIELRKRGLGAVAIARAVGCHRNTVRVRLKALSLEATP